MVPGDLEVGDDQFVVESPADPHHAPEGELVEGGRAAVTVSVRHPGSGTGPGGGRSLLGGDLRVRLVILRVRLPPAGLLRHLLV